MLRQLRCRCNPARSRALSSTAALNAANRVLEEIQCPYCGRRGEWTKWGFYERTLVEPDSRRGTPGRQNRTVKVQRLRCRCMHTHAVLDTGIVPYRRYSLEFILTAVGVWLRNMTVAALCRALWISPSTLYSWIHLYELELMAAGVPFFRRSAWAKNWQRNVTLYFQQQFLLKNARLFLEHLRPFRRCCNTPAGGWSMNAEYLVWPRHTN